jgi:hypothetical protein
MGLYRKSGLVSNSPDVDLREEGDGRGEENSQTTRTLIYQATSRRRGNIAPLSTIEMSLFSPQIQCGVCIVLVL